MMIIRKRKKKVHTNSGEITDGHIAFFLFGVESCNLEVENIKCCIFQKNKNVEYSAENSAVTAMRLKNIDFEKNAFLS